MKGYLYIVSIAFTVSCGSAGHQTYSEKKSSNAIGASPSPTASPSKNPQKIDPTPSPISAPPAATLTQCEKDATLAFTTNIVTPLAKCVGCHTAIPAFKLEAGKDDANYKVMKGYSGDWNAYLYSKAHAGGDQTANMPKDKLKLWLDAEAACKAATAKSSPAASPSPSPTATAK